MFHSRSAIAHGVSEWATWSHFKDRFWHLHFIFCCLFCFLWKEIYLKTYSFLGGKHAEMCNEYFQITPCVKKLIFYHLDSLESPAARHIFFPSSVNPFCSPGGTWSHRTGKSTKPEWKKAVVAHSLRIHISQIVQVSLTCPSVEPVMRCLLSSRNNRLSSGKAKNQLDIVRSTVAAMLTFLVL